MSQFHNLQVADVKRETVDTVSVGFEIPEQLKSDFSFEAGQYLTLSFMINGKEERRAYSICSAPSEDIIRVAVKKVAHGLVSGYIAQELKAGDITKVMAPEGGFVIEAKASNKKTYVAFAAGSGVTPIMSMAKSVAENEKGSTFHLYYGNKDADSTIFKSDFDALVEANDNIKVTYIYTRQDSGDDLTNGRISENMTKQLVQRHNLVNADAFYLCGPEEMIINGSKGIEAAGVDESKIRFELFTVPVLMESNSAEAEEGDFEGDAKIIVVYDDEEFEFTLNTKGDSILETAIDGGVDVPFSCKGAVCCTCKAKVIEGKAIMDANYALTDQELADGYILTCTAHPVSAVVKVNYDDI
ncbi:MAG: ring-1,2-phenylacetyl-CoA epoxidase subunit PaaE [Parvicella sp.]|jgi:ring-1,2-phenylacetyl-CoA epoxidase subunit PaaE